MNARICATQTVLLPGWGEDDVFEAELRRPSLLAMAAGGAIPNELMASAQKLFGEGFDAAMPLDQLGKLLIAVAKEAMAEPTYASLEEQGIQLTDLQLAAIYSFAQSGVRALEPFRQWNGSNITDGNEQAILGATE